MVDKVLTLPREKIGATIGRLDDDVMIRVTRALAMWLGVG
jgi:mRNA interferase MazF